MRVIELQPNPYYLIESLRCIGYTLDTALADIIDNSIAANAQNISIQYRWENGNPWIAILDDGCGMSKEKLKEAMCFGGASSPLETRNPHDLGRFGLGLKTASLSQCHRLTVISKRCGETHALEWDVGFLEKEKLKKWNALVPEVKGLHGDSIIGPLLEKLDTGNTGTIVIWRDVLTIDSSSKKKISENHFSEVMVQASEHIGLVFHRFLAAEKGRKAVKIDVNGTAVEGFDPFGFAVAARRELPEETVVVQKQKILIQPYVLPYRSKVSKPDYLKLGGEEGYRQNQGFYVYRNSRLIVKGTWFRLVPKTELTKLLRVRVDIPNCLDHLWQLDVKKSQAQPPQVVLDRLKEIIRRIASEGHKVYGRRGTRMLSDTVHIWQREISEGRVSYVINEKHPFVKSLVADKFGAIDKQKLSCLRIISGAFPAEVFHVDANNDDREIVPIAKKEEVTQAMSDLIRALREGGLNESSVKKQLEKNELPVSDEELSTLIQKEFHG